MNPLESLQYALHLVVETSREHLDCVPFPAVPLLTQSGFDFDERFGLMQPIIVEEAKAHGLFVIKHLMQFKSGPVVGLLLSKEPDLPDNVRTDCWLGYGKDDARNKYLYPKAE